MGRLNRTDEIDDSDDMLLDGDVVDDLGASEQAEMASSREDAPEARSVTSRCRIREQLQGDVEAFLARGGHIDHVDPRQMVDAPRRPVSDYGSRPI